MNTKHFHALLFFVLLFWVPAGNYWNATWLHKWFVLGAGVTLLSTHEIYRYRKDCAVLFLSIFMSGCVMFFYRNNFYSSWNYETQINIARNASLTCISFLLLIFWLLKAPVKLIRRIIALGGLATAVKVIYLTILGMPPNARGAFIGNPSMTGCYIACCMPLLLISYHRLDAVQVFARYLAGVVMLGAILCTATTIPILVLVTQVLAYVCWLYKDYLKYILAACAMCVAFFLLADYLSTDAEGFFSDSGRYSIWIMGLRYWWHAPWLVHLFGFGIGSTQTLLPTMQWELNRNNHDWWLWFHNDWLQCLFELGVFGFAAAITVFVNAARLAWDGPTGRYFTCLMGIGCFAFFNYPLRMAITACLVTFIVVGIFKIDNDARNRLA